MEARRDQGGDASGSGMIDLHNHLLPGVDDGATDEDESAAGLERFREEGITELVATPHFEAALQLRPADFTARMDEIDRAWKRMQSLAESTGLTVHRGVELRLDLARPDLSDPRLRLGGGRFALCEFPWFTVPPRSDRVVAVIREDGWVPVIAHPERYPGLEEDPDVVQRWLDAGAYLQVNGGSLLGRYGRAAASAAARLLEWGCVQYVASDYHARGDPEIRRYRDELAALLGEAAARRLTEINPARLLNGELPLPVSPAANREDRAAGAAGVEPPSGPSAQRS